MSHTAEPWIADDSESTAICANFGGVKYWIADFAGFPGPNNESGADNRDRVVACVNACAGIPTNMVANVVSFGMNGHSAAIQAADDRREYWSNRWANEFDMHMEAEKQRDLLLTALHITRGNVASLGPAGAIDPYTPYREWLAMIDSAIASVRAINPVVKESLTTETTAPAIVFYPAGSLGEYIESDGGEA